MGILKIALQCCHEHEVRCVRPQHCDPHTVGLLRKEGLPCWDWKGGVARGAPQPPGCAGSGWEGGRDRRGHLFDTLVSICYLVCIFPGADYITACVDKHLESEGVKTERNVK